MGDGQEAASPQYLFINRAPSSAWEQNRPATIGPGLFAEVIDALGPVTRGGCVRRLGLSFILSYHNGPRERLDEAARRVLELAVQLDAPVLLTLDGANWWDAGSRGYDPANANNVEWTGPGPEHAVKVCWRNWGRPLRVRPAPNLASPKFRESSRVELTRLATLVRDFTQRLPAEKRWLVPGVKVGWEASIGINAFHYPDGNRLYEAHPKDESHDPANGMDMAKDFAGGLAPLGYAALASEGKRPPGAVVTLADQERIVADYLRFLAATCRAAGWTRDEIFLHAGGQYAPWPLHYTHGTAVTPEAVPGYSLYDTAPDDAGDLRTVLADARRDDWCAAEWLTHARTPEGWARDLDRTLSFGHCRHLTIYNWEGIRDQPHALAGIRRALDVGPTE